MILTYKTFKKDILDMVNNFEISIFDAIQEYKFRHKLEDNVVARLVKGEIKEKLTKELIKKRSIKE